MSVSPQKPTSGKAYFTVQDVDNGRKYKVSLRREDFSKVKVKKIRKTLSQVAFVEAQDFNLYTQEGMFLRDDEIGASIGLDERTVLLLRRVVVDQQQASSYPQQSPASLVSSGMPGSSSPMGGVPSFHFSHEDKKSNQQEYQWSPDRAWQPVEALRMASANVGEGLKYTTTTTAMIQHDDDPNINKKIKKENHWEIISRHPQSPRQVEEDDHFNHHNNKDGSSFHNNHRVVGMFYEEEVTGMRPAGGEPTDVMVTQEEEAVLSATKHETTPKGTSGAIGLRQQQGQIVAARRSKSAATDEENEQQKIMSSVDDPSQYDLKSNPPPSTQQTEDCSKQSQNLYSHIGGATTPTTTATMTTPHSHRSGVVYQSTPSNNNRQGVPSLHYSTTTSAVNASTPTTGIKPQPYLTETQKKLQVQLYEEFKQMQQNEQGKGMEGNLDGSRRDEERGKVTVEEPSGFIQELLATASTPLVMSIPATQHTPVHRVALRTTTSSNVAAGGNVATLAPCPENHQQQNHPQNQRVVGSTPFEFHQKLAEMEMGSAYLVDTSPVGPPASRQQQYPLESVPYHHHSIGGTGDVVANPLYAFRSSPAGKECEVSTMTRHELLHQWRKECTMMTELWEKDKKEWCLEKEKMQRQIQQLYQQQKSDHQGGSQQSGDSTGVQDEIIEEVLLDLEEAVCYTNRLKSELNSAMSEVVDLRDRLSTTEGEKLQLKQKSESSMQALQELQYSLANQMFSGNVEMAQDAIQTTLQKAIYNGKIRELEESNCQLMKKLTLETKKRKELHFAIEELRGNIRVIVRMRPSTDELPSELRPTTANSTNNNNNVELAQFFDKTKIDVCENRNIVTLSSPTTAGGGTKVFEFYRVLGPAAGQQDVFEEVRPVIQSALDGYNVCIVAYGQTGSGKTHTIFGSGLGTTGSSGNYYYGGKDFASLNLLGVLPRAIEEIFSELNKATGAAAGGSAMDNNIMNRSGDAQQTTTTTTSYKKATKFFSVTCSMVELYNDAIRDLLPEQLFSSPPLESSPGTSKSANSAHQSARAKVQSGRCELRFANGSPHIVGLKEHSVRNANEALELLIAGGSARQVHFTKQNPTSSRSHALFTIKLSIHDVITGAVKKSKIVFVDLAGSERISKSQSVGDRLKEAQQINKSLSALGDVVEFLSKQQKYQQQLSQAGGGPGRSSGSGGGDQHMTAHSSFVPYRNSKLTMVLQECLGGNAKTLMIACIAPNKVPCECNTGETQSTLLFASRVRCVRNDVSQLASATGGSYNTTTGLMRSGSQHQYANQMQLPSSSSIAANPKMTSSYDDDGAVANFPLYKYEQGEEMSEAKTPRGTTGGHPPLPRWK